MNRDDYIKKIYEKATKFLYEENKKIIALSLVYVNKAPNESFGTYLCVDPRYNDVGLGLELVLKALKYAKEYGSSSFRVMIRSSNSMLFKFYSKLGFKVTQELKYPNSEITEYEMVKLLNK